MAYDSGGNGAGNGQYDFTSIINANNNDFVGVAIQYRLGAFGFLASDEVSRYGVVNAGILDQNFALQWVQAYIKQFGGDPRNVTIAGESAGGGSVMLHALAQGGSLGTSLFKNVIAASPYLPFQYGYKDFEPSQSYYAFAAQAGCFDGVAYGKTNQSIFECLLTKDSKTLQEANVKTSLAPFSALGLSFLSRMANTFLMFLQHSSTRGESTGSIFSSETTAPRVDCSSCETRTPKRKSETGSRPFSLSQRKKTLPKSSFNTPSTTV